METKQITCDIPKALDSILSSYAESIGVPENTIIVESLAKAAQRHLYILTANDNRHTPTFNTMLAWRNSSPHKQSLDEHILVGVLGKVPNHITTTTIEIKPCKRTRKFLRIPSELLPLIHTARQTTPLQQFATQAIFKNLEHRLSIGANMTQEFIPADMTREHRKLLEEIREVKKRLFNLETAYTPQSANAELITQVLITLIQESARQPKQIGGVEHGHN